MCRFKEFTIWSTILILQACANQNTIQNSENHEDTKWFALVERITNLEQKSYKTAERCTDRSARIKAHLEKRINKAEKLIVKQSSEIDRLTKEVKKLQEEKGTFSQLKTKAADKLKGNVFDFGNTKRLRNRRFLLEDKVETFVGFTAYLDHNVNHLGIDQSIVFNKILFNDGGAYHNSSGMFTCPVTGVYMFFFEVGSGARHQIVAKLVVNGSNTVGGIADSEYHDSHEAQGSNMAILKLSAGTHVWVENYRWADKFVEGGTTDRFTTFSGILLYQN